MAVVGEAQIIVRAITTNVERDIRRGFSNLDGAARSTGRNLGNSFSEGFNRSGAVSVFGRVAEGIRTLVPEAEAARLAYQRLARANFVLTPALGGLVGAISSVIGGLGALVGAAGAAAASLVALGSIFSSFGLGLIASRFALGGVGRALGALNNQTGGAARVTEEATTQTARYAKTLAEVREEMQQLRFDAEEAALSQEEAAIKLEQARDNLLRTADLPINSIARRQAELDFKQADLAYRRAKDRTEDLNAQIKKGIDNPLIEPQVRAPQMPEIGGGGADPFAGLNKYQIDFVKFLMTLKPLYKELQLTASEAFLPPLQQAISLLAQRFFPTLNTGIGLVAAANGQASIAIAESITNAENLYDVSLIFESAGRQITSLGRIFGQFWDIAASLLSSVAPQAERFLSFLEDRLGTFASFLDVEQALGRLDGFFKTSGDMLADFGRVFGNIFRGFGQIIMANFGPGTGGQYLLDWLIEATDKFANLDETAGGGNSLSRYFLDAATNAQKVLSSVGALLSELLAAGANPNIGRAFDILAEGAPAIGRILEKAADSAPAFAEAVVQATRFIDIFTDTRSIELFWEVVESSVRIVNDILENEFINTLLLTVSQIAAVALAIGSVLKVGQFAFRVVAGSLAFLLFNSDSVAEGMLKLRGVIDTVKVRTALLGMTIRDAGGGFLGFSTAIRPVISQLVTMALKVGAALAVITALSTAFARYNEEVELSEEENTRLSGSFDSLLKNQALAADETERSIPLIQGLSQVTDDAYGSSLSLADAFTQTRDESTKAFDAFMTGLKSIPLLGDAIIKLGQGVVWLLSKIGILGPEFENIFNFDPSQLRAGEELINGLGNELATLAQTNIPAASLSFQQLAAEAGAATQGELLEFLNQMPALKEELLRFAEANNLASDDVGLLNIAMQNTPAVGRAIADTMAGMTAAALDASGRVQTLVDAIEAFNGLNLTSEEAGIRAQQSIFRLTDTIKQYEGSTDLATQGGLAIRQSFIDSAQEANKYLAGLVELGVETDEVTAAHQGFRDQLLVQANSLGMVGTEAQKYVDTLLANPETLITKLGLEGVPLAKSELESLYATGSTPVNVPISIRAVENGLQTVSNQVATVQKAGSEEMVPTIKLDNTSLNTAKNSINSFVNQPRTIEIKTKIVGSSANIVTGTSTIRVVPGALGNFFSFANGGIGPGIYKGRPGSLYKFAEPETRWEAFISGKIGQEKRNIGIWKEAGKRLGVYNEAAMGAMQSTFGSQGASTQSLVQTTNSAPRVENNIQITVNPSPGMDERDLASMVSRRLAYELRRGTYRT